MPDFTLRALLRTEKVNTKGFSPVIFVVTVNRKRRKISTGIVIAENDWDAAKERVKYSASNADVYNIRLMNRRAELERELFKAADAGTLTHRSGNVKKEDSNFLLYAEKCLKEFSIEDSTRARWVIELQHIRAYAPELSFAAITPAWLYRYQKHRMNIGNVVINTARKAFVFIRRVFNEALREGRTDLYPFRSQRNLEGFQLPKETPSTPVYLTMEELDRLEALFARTEVRGALRSTLAHFLLECYSGIRHSDWTRWQTERLTDNDNFKLIAKKNKETIYLPLQHSPRLRAIVERIRGEGIAYIYSPQDANRQLKMLALLAGIDKRLTTHTGRHTCCTLLLQKGFSRETIAQVIGVSIKIVDIYAKMTGRKIINEYQQIGGL